MRNSGCIFFFFAFFLFSLTLFAEEKGSGLEGELDKLFKEAREVQKKASDFMEEEELLLKDILKLKLECENYAYENYILDRRIERQKELLKAFSEEEDPGDFKRELEPLLMDTLFFFESRLDSQPPYLKEERKKKLKETRLYFEDAAFDIRDRLKSILDLISFELELGLAPSKSRGSVVIDGGFFEGEFLYLPSFALFFLSSDKKRAAVWSIEESVFLALDSSYLKSLVKLSTAIERGDLSNLIWLPSSRDLKKGSLR